MIKNRKGYISNSVSCLLIFAFSSYSSLSYSEGITSETLERHQNLYCHLHAKSKNDSLEKNSDTDYFNISAPCSRINTRLLSSLVNAFFMFGEDENLKNEFSIILDSLQLDVADALNSLEVKNWNEFLMLLPRLTLAQIEDFISLLNRDSQLLILIITQSLANPLL